MNVVRTMATASAVLLGAAALAACGSDSDSSGAAEVSSETSAADVADSGIVVSDFWARTSPAGATTGAVYLNVSSAEANAVVGASVDSSIAGESQIHEVTMTSMDDDAMDMEDDDMDDDAMEDMGGTMTMSQVDRIELPAGETVSFAPGGFHVMLLDLVNPLVAGDTFDVTLTFASGDDITMAVTVKDNA